MELVHPELLSWLKLSQHKPRLTFISRAAHWSASPAVLGLLRKVYCETFLPAECS